MGLKCSVLGHKYGDATVERDREEQGSEVVITIREIEVCRRCGEERIVSENKEVTTLATPDEPDDAPETGATDEPSAGEVTADQGAAEPTPNRDEETTTVEDDVTADADDASDGAGSFAAEATDGTDGAGESAFDDSPPVDGAEDAEILDAEGGAVGDEQVADDELADPSIEDAGFTTDSVKDEPVEEDAVIIDDEAEPDEETGRQPGAWPEEPDDGGEDDWTPSDALDEDGPITAPDAGTENNAAVTIPDGQFRCPECGYTTLVEDSSLRAGDFCPDCQKGSLVHEPRDETRKE